MGDKLICDYCYEREAIGVYASGWGPVSLSMCGSCVEVKDINTNFNTLTKYSRNGIESFEKKVVNINGVDIVTKERKMSVYFEGEYIPALEYIKNLTEVEINKVMKNRPSFKEDLINKLKNK